MTREPTIQLRLDKSRDFSTIHGERNPGDPHYYVHAMQDGLPFGADDFLVPDDGKLSSWTEAVEREDGTTKIIRHEPLYTAKMRASVEKKVKRLAAKRAGVRPVARAEVDEDDEADTDEADDTNFGPDEINLISWLRGDFDYQPNELFAAVRKRYGKNCTTKKEVVEELVFDMPRPLLPEAELHPSIKSLLDKPSTAVAA